MYSEDNEIAFVMAVQGARVVVASAVVLQSLQTFFHNYRTSVAIQSEETIRQYKSHIYLVNSNYR